MERLSHTETADIPVHDIRTYTMATKKNGGKKCTKENVPALLEFTYQSKTLYPPYYPLSMPS